MILHVIFLVINLLAIGMNARTASRTKGWKRGVSLALVAFCSLGAGIMAVAIYQEVVNGQ